MSKNEALLKVLAMQPDVLAHKLDVSCMEAMNLQHVVQSVLILGTTDKKGMREEIVKAYLKQLQSITKLIY